MKLPAMLACFVLATAVSSVSVSAADDKPAADGKDKVICRTDKVTGSRAKVRRTCMTRAQWDDLALRTKKGLDDFNRSAAGGAKSSMDTGAMAQAGGT